MASSVSDLHPLDTRSTPSVPGVIARNVSTHCPVSPGGKITPSWEPLIKPEALVGGSKDNAPLLAPLERLITHLTSPKWLLFFLPDSFPSSFPPLRWFITSQGVGAFILMICFLRELSESLGLRNDRLSLRSAFCWEQTRSWKVEAGRLAKKLPWWPMWKGWPGW